MMYRNFTNTNKRDSNMSIKSKDDSSTSKITLAISPEELEKQLKGLSSAEGAFKLELANSDKWFKDIQFYDLSNKQLAEDTGFYKVSFKVIGYNYLSDSKQQGKIGKVIVKKTKTNAVLNITPTQEEYSKCPKELKADISIDDMLFMNEEEFKKLHIKIRGYITDTRRKIHKNIWHKKMNIWKSVAFDYFNPELMVKSNPRGSNKKRELVKFLGDSIKAIKTRISKEVEEDKEKRFSNPKLNHSYLGTEEKHDNKFKLEFKTADGKTEKREVDCLYLRLKNMEKEISKYCDNPEYDITIPQDDIK